MQQDTHKTPGKKKANGQSEEVKGILDRFAQALGDADTKTIGSLFGFPAYFVSESAASAITDQAAVEKMFGGAKQLYAERGIKEAFAEIKKVDWVGERVCVVDVNWPYIDEHGKNIGSESSTYTFRRDDHGKLGLVVILMRGEKGKPKH